MAWTYCRKCGEGLAAPTAEEVLFPGTYCCPVCEADNEPNKSLEELVLELIHRVDELETKLRSTD